MNEYKTIMLTADEMQRCIDFSDQSAKTQQDIEFGQKDTKPRSLQEIARDNLIGKMAEVAVARMLREEFGIHYSVNFDIYPRGEWDDCDIQVKSWSVDIKSTRNGHWLLFETNKLKMRQEQTINNLPDAIFMCRTPWNRDNDTPIGNVELIGAISLSILLSDDAKVKHLKKGDFIPNTKTKLQADNLAVEFDKLNHDWKQIITHMVKNNPPDSSQYCLL